MRMRLMRSLVALVFVLASMATTTAQSPPPEESLTRSVEIPGAGAVVALPREWRTWQNEAYDAARRQGPGVWTTDVDTGWTCQLWSSDDLASAEAAADALVEAPEAADIGISKGEPFETPVGSAVLVTFGSPEALQPPAHVQHEAYVDAPLGVVQIWCRAAPADYVHELVRTIAPLAADYSPPPFDPRVEMVDHGFAVDFGVEWSVTSRTEHLGARLLGGSTVLHAQTAAVEGDGPPASRCSIEDATDVPGLTGLTSVEDWKAAIKDAGKGTLRAKEPRMKVVELPSGPAIRAHWRLKSDPTTAWIVSDDEHVVVLLCSSERPPRDRWRSIAKTIEFLPADA